MNRQMPFTFQSGMWGLLFAGMILLLLNDPVGDLLNRQFGPNTERWTTNIILIAVVLFTFLHLQKKKKTPPPSE